MKIVFVHGALVFDGAWWWHRMGSSRSALSAWDLWPWSCLAA